MNTHSHATPKVFMFRCEWVFTLDKNQRSRCIRIGVHDGCEYASSTVMQKIVDYQWPGNVRELENTLERSLLFTLGTEIQELKLDNSMSTPIAVDWKQRKEQAMAEVEQAFLKASLQQHQGDIKEIAAHMELSTRAVYNKLKKYDINPEKYRS